MSNPVPTTELEAVNRLLSTIGIARLADLTATDREDQLEAQAVLAEVTREVQVRGWIWNKDYNYPLTPTDEKFLVPTNALQIVFPRALYPSAVSAGPQFTVRDESGVRKVWDRDEHTFVLAGLDELLVEITWGFEFVDLPEAARWYIVVRAARAFANRMLAGQGSINGFSEQDEAAAHRALMEAEGEVGEHTIFDSWDVARVLDRGVSW